MDEKGLAGAAVRLFLERDFIAGRASASSKQRMKFEYGLEKTRQSILRLLKGAKPKKPG